MILLSVKMATVSDWAIIESKMIASTWPREVTDGMGVLGTDFWVQKYKQIMASKAPKKKKERLLACVSQFHQAEQTSILFHFAM